MSWNNAEVVCGKSQNRSFRPPHRHRFSAGHRAGKGSPPVPIGAGCPQGPRPAGMVPCTPNSPSGVGSFQRPASASNWTFDPNFTAQGSSQVSQQRDYVRSFQTGAPCCSQRPGKGKGKGTNRAVQQKLHQQNEQQPTQQTHHTATTPSATLCGPPQKAPTQNNPQLITNTKPNEKLNESSYNAGFTEQEIHSFAGLHNINLQAAATDSLPREEGHVVNSDVSLDEVYQHLERCIRQCDWRRANMYIKRKVWELAIDKNGSHLLQQLLNLAGSPKSSTSSEAMEAWKEVVNTVLDELRGHVLEVCTANHSHYANYVLQWCIQALSPERFVFMLEELKHHVTEAAMHFAGCRVLQRIVEHIGDKDNHTLHLLQEMLPNLKKISLHQYGNYVIQKWLEMASPKQKDLIGKAFIDLGQNEQDVIDLVTNKFASNVLETAVELLSPKIQEQLADMLMQVLDKPRDRRKYKNTSYGSHVYARVKLYNSRKDEKSVTSPTCSSVASDSTPARCLSSLATGSRGTAASSSTTACFAKMTPGCCGSSSPSTIALQAWGFVGSVHILAVPAMFPPS